LQIEKEGYTSLARDIELAKGETKEVAVLLRRDEPSELTIAPPTPPDTRSSPSASGVVAEAARGGSSDVAPEGSSRRSVTATFEEPPPLEEWLVGREILTVKQDGSAMFTKIQDALDALKTGQVVEVLDGGPYTERLVIENHPVTLGWSLRSAQF
jgi:hypothetical protein